MKDVLLLLKNRPKEDSISDDTIEKLNRPVQDAMSQLPSLEAIKKLISDVSHPVPKTTVEAIVAAALEQLQHDKKIEERPGQVDTLIEGIRLAKFVEENPSAATSQLASKVEELFDAAASPFATKDNTSSMVDEAVASVMSKSFSGDRIKDVVTTVISIAMEPVATTISPRESGNGVISQDVQALMSIPEAVVMLTSTLPKLVERIEKIETSTAAHGTLCATTRDNVFGSIQQELKVGIESVSPAIENIEVIKTGVGNMQKLIEKVFEHNKETAIKSEAHVQEEIAS
jgi:hypothetical protein